MSNYEGAIVSHPKNANLKIGVTYWRLNRRAISVDLVVPCYDTRDTNNDGKVSWWEWFWEDDDMQSMSQAKLYSYLYVETKRTIGEDVDLLADSQRMALGAAYSMASKALASSVFDRVGGSAIRRALVAAGVEEVTSYFVKKEVVKRLVKALGVGSL